MTKWFYKVMGEEIGPLTPSELLEKARSGEITHDTPIRKGDGDWVSPLKVTGLFDQSENESSPVSVVSSWKENATPASDFADAERTEANSKNTNIPLLISAGVILLALLIVLFFFWGGATQPESAKVTPEKKKPSPVIEKVNVNSKIEAARTYLESGELDEAKRVLQDVLETEGISEGDAELATALNSRVDSLIEEIQRKKELAEVEVIKNRALPEKKEQKEKQFKKSKERIQAIADTKEAAGGFDKLSINEFDVIIVEQEKRLTEIEKRFVKRVASKTANLYAENKLLGLKRATFRLNEMVIEMKRKLHGGSLDEATLQSIEVILTTPAKDKGVGISNALDEINKKEQERRNDLLYTLYVENTQRWINLHSGSKQRKYALTAAYLVSTCKRLLENQKIIEEDIEDITPIVLSEILELLEHTDVGKMPLKSGRKQMTVKEIWVKYDLKKEMEARIRRKNAPKYPPHIEKLREREEKVKRKRDAARKKRLEEAKKRNG